MRQDSPRDILIWDDASHIPADIKATDSQPGVCLFLAARRNTSTQVLE